MIEFQSIPAVIAEQLANLIIDGKLQPGEHLTEADLEKRFGFSRSPIREALRLLEREELVRIVPRKGAYVTRILKQDIQEIYACRSVLCGLAARESCRLMSPENLRRFEGLVLQMNEAAKKELPEEYFRFNVMFHDLVAETAGNERLQDIIRRLGKQSLRLRHLSLSMPSRMSKSLLMHKQVVAAFSAHDCDAAERFTRQLIEDARQVLLDADLADGREGTQDQLSKLPTITSNGRNDSREKRE